LVMAIPDWLPGCYHLLLHQEFLAAGDKT